MAKRCPGSKMRTIAERMALKAANPAAVLKPCTSLSSIRRPMTISTNPMISQITSAVSQNKLNGRSIKMMPAMMGKLPPRKTLSFIKTSLLLFIKSRTLRV